MLEDNKKFCEQILEEQKDNSKTGPKSEKSTKKSSTKDSRKKSKKKGREEKSDKGDQITSSTKITKFSFNILSKCIQYNKLDAKKPVYPPIQRIPIAVPLVYNEFKNEDSIIIFNSFYYFFRNSSIIKGEYTIENYYPNVSLLYNYNYNGIDPLNSFGNIYHINRNSLAILNDVNNTCKFVSIIIDANQHFLVSYQIYFEKIIATNSFILKGNIQIKFNRYKQIRNRPCNTYSKTIYKNNEDSKLIEEDQIKWENAYFEENQFNAEIDAFYDSIKNN